VIRSPKTPSRLPFLGPALAARRFVGAPFVSAVSAATATPFRARATAAAAPMPRLAPMTMATLFGLICMRSWCVRLACLNQPSYGRERQLLFVPLACTGRGRRLGATPNCSLGEPATSHKERPLMLQVQTRLGGSGLLSQIDFVSSLQKNIKTL